MMEPEEPEPEFMSNSWKFNSARDIARSHNVKPRSREAPKPRSPRRANSRTLQRALVRLSASRYPGDVGFQIIAGAHLGPLKSQKPKTLSKQFNHGWCDNHFCPVGSKFGPFWTNPQVQTPKPLADKALLSSSRWANGLQQKCRCTEQEEAETYSG